MDEKFKTESLNRSQIREKVMFDINLPVYDREEQIPNKSLENDDLTRIRNVVETGSAEKQIRQNMTPFQLKVEDEIKK